MSGRTTGPRGAPASRKRSSSGPRVVLRRADADDVDRLVPLFGAYREFYHERRAPTVEREYLTERIDRDEAVVFLAEMGRTVVGFTLLYPSFSSVSLRPIWVLNDLYVLPERRRQGIAAWLLRRAHRFAVQTGADYLTLETAKDNPAQLLYEAEGWTRDDVFLHYERKVERAASGRGVRTRSRAALTPRRRRRSHGRDEPHDRE
jgi:ribosomal protein S18 acetylase RimI-like enzyme